MYIILVKCNDHYFYVTKIFIIIFWSVINTAKDQHKSKPEVHVYSEFPPRTNVLVHSETKYNRD